MNQENRKKEYRCPQCDRFIYDRRRQRCGFCSAVLPEELLFSKEESDKINQDIAEIKEERRQLKLRLEADERKRKGKQKDHDL